MCGRSNYRDQKLAVSNKGDAELLDRSTD